MDEAPDPTPEQLDEWLATLPPYIQVDPWLGRGEQVSQALEYASALASALLYEVQWRAKELGMP
jgi:hypothetical protein